MKRPKRFSLPLTLATWTLIDLHLEQQFHRGLDFGLGRVRDNTENHLFVLVGNKGALFGNHRREQNLHQPLRFDGA